LNRNATPDRQPQEPSGMKIYSQNRMEAMKVLKKYAIFESMRRNVRLLAGKISFWLLVLSPFLVSSQTTFRKTTSVSPPVSAREMLDFLMKNDTSQALYKILFNPRKYRLQILYTQINRDKHNQPSFKTFSYRADDQEYWYPASMVKLPVAILALEKIRKLKVKGLDKNTAMICQRSSGGTFQTSVAEAIRKMLIVSDNYSYTLLFEFIGTAYLHQRLREMGYDKVSITQNFSYTDKPFQGFQFVTEEGSLLYEEKCQPRLPMPDIAVQSPVMGMAYYDRNGKLVQQARNFKNANHFPLADVHRMLIAVLFHESVPLNQRLGLVYEDYDFLKHYMSIFPKECRNPVYQESEFHDSVFKFFLDANSRQPKDTQVRCFNKVGIALGFLSDATYFVDYKTGTEYLLSCVIYTNENNILGDDQYEYNHIGYPFYANLNRVIYQYERTRPRKYLPDLQPIRYGEEAP
jgi:hypothetical protein